MNTDKNEKITKLLDPHNQEYLVDDDQVLVRYGALVDKQYWAPLTTIIHVSFEESYWKLTSKVGPDISSHHIKGPYILSSVIKSVYNKLNMKKYNKDKPKNLFPGIQGLYITIYTNYSEIRNVIDDLKMVHRDIYEIFRSKDLTNLVNKYPEHDYYNPSDVISAIEPVVLSEVKKYYAGCN